MTKEEHIMSVAEKLFAVHGFNGTSVRDIASKAKVNVSMISYYFGSKENLLVDLFKWRMDEGLNFAKAITEKQELSEIEKLDSFIDNFVNRILKLKDFYLLMSTQQVITQNKNIQSILKGAKQSYIELHSQIIDSGYSNGIFTKKPSYHFLQCTIAGTLFNAMQSIKMYKESIKKEDKDYDFKDFDAKYYAEAACHVKQIVRALVGYQDNQ